MTELLRRTPPHNDEAERAVLGSILIDNRAIDEVAGEISPTDFFRPANALLFEGMLELSRTGAPIDELTLAKHLEQTKRLESVGGVASVAALASTVPSSENAVYYAKLVREPSMLRTAALASHECLSDIHESSDGAEQILERVERRMFEATRARLRSAPSDIDFLSAEMAKRLAAPATELGLRYGFVGLDDLTHGAHKGQLVIVAGRPSMGKSTFGLNLWRNFGATRREPSPRVLFCSLEMSQADAFANVVCSVARVDSHRWRAHGTHRLTRGEERAISDAIDWVNRLRGLRMDDESQLSPLTLRAKARRTKAEHGLDALIVDYLQLMVAPPGMHKAARHEVVAEISRSLKALARELEIPVVALAQLNRNVEDRVGNRPRLSDLRESGAIEADADVVMLLHRESYYEADPDKREATKNQATLILAKNRNGPTGDVQLHYQPEFALFSEPVR